MAQSKLYLYLRQSKNDLLIYCILYRFMPVLKPLNLVLQKMQALNKHIVQFV